MCLAARLEHARDKQKHAVYSTTIRANRNSAPAWRLAELEPAALLWLEEDQYDRHSITNYTTRGGAIRNKARGGVVQFAEWRRVSMPMVKCPAGITTMLPCRAYEMRLGIV
jgi:hypothetical protein